MATYGNAISIKPGSAQGQHYLVIDSRLNAEIADVLLEGATAALHEAGATWEVVSVPGPFEIPSAIAMASEFKGPRYDGYVALGCLILEEPRDDIVAVECNRALMDLSVADGIALGNGLVLIDDGEHAWECARAHAADLNAGGAAAGAAMAMVALKKTLEG